MATTLGRWPRRATKERQTMARIREIKPEFFLDEEIAALSPLTRLAFIALWQLADREGRIEDRPTRLRAQIFPYDQAVDMAGVLDELAQSPGRFIVRYQVESRPYLEIRSFRRHQRPHPKEKPSELPAPPGQGETSTSREISRQAVESPGEPGNSGTSRAGSSGISGSSGPSAAFGTRAQSDARAGDPTATAATPGPVALAEACALVVQEAATLAPAGPRPPTAWELTQLFGRIRSEVLKTSMGWQTPTGQASLKADTFLRQLAGDPEALADIAPTIELYFEKARGSPNGKECEVGFAFGAWLHRFQDLREELRGERRPAQQLGPRDAAFLRSVQGRNAC
jgi:hypothetical protein